MKYDFTKRWEAIVAKINHHRKQASRRRGWRRRYHLWRMNVWIDKEDTFLRWARRMQERLSKL